MRKIVLFVADLAAAVLLVAGIWGMNYLIPQKGIHAGTVLASSEGNKNTRLKQTDTNSKSFQTVSREQKIQNLLESGSGGMQTTKVSLDRQDWHQKFADKFTDQVVSTDTSYTSPNLSIQLTSNSIKTDQLDSSGDGGHKVGSGYKWRLLQQQQACG